MLLIDIIFITLTKFEKNILLKKHLYKPIAYLKVKFN